MVKIIAAEDQIDAFILFLVKELLKIYHEQMADCPDCIGCKLVMFKDYHHPKKCCCGENREVFDTVQAIENTQRYLTSIVYDFVFGNQFETFLSSICQQLNSTYSMSYVCIVFGLIIRRLLAISFQIGFIRHSMG